MEKNGRRIMLLSTFITMMFRPNFKKCNEINLSNLKITVTYLRELTDTLYTYYIRCSHNDDVDHSHRSQTQLNFASHTNVHNNLINVFYSQIKTNGKYPIEL